MTNDFQEINTTNDLCWGYNERLNKKCPSNGEKILVLWKNGKITEEIMRLRDCSDDLGHYNVSYIDAKINGTPIEITLAGSGLKIKRI